MLYLPLPGVFLLKLSIVYVIYIIYFHASPTFHIFPPTTGWMFSYTWISSEHTQSRRLWNNRHLLTKPPDFKNSQQPFLIGAIVQSENGIGWVLA